MARRVTLAERLVDAARAAIAACSGERLVRAALADDKGPARIWAVGKAACAMARGAQAALGPGLTGGLVLAKAPADAEGLSPTLRLFEASHPVPDARGVAATAALLADAAALGPDERALLLLSGGASALLAATVPGVTLDELRAATDTLLRAGASIDELNVVRRHLGAALGGRLAAATRASVEVLALSDVASGDPAAIGSGPAAADPSTVIDARAFATRVGLAPLAFAETIKPGDPALARVTFRVLASPETLAEAAARALADAGWSVRRRESLVSGPVESLAAEVTACARALAPGEAWVAAGEPTLVVRGGGRGGRAQHLALLLARELRGGDVSFVACASDGSDGPTGAAGGAVDGTTWEEARARGLDPADALARYDSDPLLAAAGAQIVTGPTGTNLTDLFLIARRA